MSAAGAAILAGGKGTRLASVIGSGQKVVASVSGRPFVTRLLSRVEAAGLPEVVLCTGHSAAAVEALGDSYGALRLRYSHEAEPLGTAGALANALGAIAGDPVLALNGDSYCAVDLAAVLDAHRRHGGDASMVVVRVPDAARFGSVEFDAASSTLPGQPTGGVVRGFVEKGRTGPGWVNAGIYVFARRVLEAIPRGTPVSLEREVLPSLTTLHALPFEGEFLDIGTPESFARAESFLAGESR